MALYVVATPIGSMKDITLRALEVLGSVDMICCEDTRRTRRLLEHHGVKPPELVSYHEHNERSRARQVLPRLANEDVALVSNAGTPAFADPGWRLVRAAIDAGVEVLPIPGPCAAVAALVTSGLPVHRFSFLGWAPKKKARLARLLDAERNTPGSLIIYEAPGRVVKLLAAALDILGDREASVSRELTKLHEETRRGSLSSLIESFGSAGPRGECTVVISGA